MTKAELIKWLNETREEALPPEIILQHDLDLELASIGNFKAMLRVFTAWGLSII